MGAVAPTFPEKLDDELLYLIVFGPGYGESIVVRAPPDQWLVVDSLTMEPRDQSPAVSMLEGHRARWTALILTHPHEDHAAGFGALLDIGTGPVGCVAPYVHPPETWRASDDLEEHLRRGEVEAALAAIQYRWESDSAAQWELVAGDVRTLGTMKLTVLHPSRGEVEAAMKAPPPADPNVLASPLLVEWRDVRLVLGSDLPRSGWRSVHSRNPAGDLARHQGFKVAHHGSKGALHDAVLKNPSREREFVVTPFHRGRGLPCFDDTHGIEGLLRHTDVVTITSLRDVSGVGARPWRISRQHVRESRGSASTAGLGRNVKSLPRPGMDPAGWVALGFDAAGAIRDRQYGEGAALIFHDASVAHPSPKKPATKRGNRKTPRGRT